MATPKLVVNISFKVYYYQASDGAGNWKFFIACFDTSCPRELKNSNLNMVKKLMYKRF